MKKWIKKRLREGSTWAGFGLATVGIGQVLDFDQAPAIAEAIGAAGSQVIGGNWLGGLIALAGGVAIAIQDKE